MINNLINNSITHAYNEGQVAHLRFDITAHKNDLQLIYQDDGNGMDTLVQKKISLPF
ncbi:ATP-binding protein [Shewanella intestini]|uniref:ATP-binding protein n=1 Tax=Shewanella intestini TaxID=2017544 RepID=A0ABS5HXL8_9GAMM|nr:ATP-binding protein [Shewanella intestini]MRG34943.1 hypothetical protein [Shewanella sp. XMDDZSB0408]